MKKSVVFLLGMFLFSMALPVAAASIPETKAQYATVLDVGSGKVLFAKDADTRMPTSSMSKVMTMYLVFEALDKGALKLDQTVKVSKKAWAEKGSRMFLREGQDVAVEDLIRGVIVQSGNDAAVALAEAVAGSEASFAVAMNEKATALGLTGSHFANASGLPDPEHYSTARDLAVLAAALIRDFPARYSYYSEKSFTFNGITQANRNPLLYRDMGVDGVKTGHTEDAGFGLISSAMRAGRRVISVVNGLTSMKEREEESAKLIEWAFAEYDIYELVKKDEQAERVPVWLGVAPFVPVAPDKDVVMTLARDEREQVKIEKMTLPEVEAPVTKGQTLGKMVVLAPGGEPVEVPLLASADVPRLGWFKAFVLRIKRKLVQ